jgi:hypothetical protein
MKTTRIILSIDPRHLPWLARHAGRLGYYGQRDYLSAILNTALLREMEANAEEPLPAAASEDRESEDGIPF